MHLLPDGQQIIFRIIRVKFRVSGCEILQFHRLVGIKGVDRFQRVRNQFLNALQGQAERMHRAFQPLEQVDAHQTADALFSPYLRQAVFALMVQIGVLCHPTGKNVVGRRVNAQRQADNQIVNFAVGDRVRQVGQRRPLGKRRQARREVTDLVHVVIFFNMLSGTRNRNAVQNFKEIEI